MINELPHPLIKHVVVLMLENRGFDHLMGWLYDAEETPTIVSSPSDARSFIGLSTLSESQLAALANPGPNNYGNLPINYGARSPKTPSYNTGESYQHIMNQMWGVDQPSTLWFDRAARTQFLSTLGPVPPMNGYALDFYEETYLEQNDLKPKDRRRLSKDELSEALDTYAPEQLPVLSGLARNYAVSDEWFCSVPSQTNTNRAFSIAGTSRGLVNNSFYDPETWNPGVAFAKWKFEDLQGTSQADALPVSTRSIFEVLEQASLSWTYFWQSEWPPKAMTGVEWQYTRVMIPLLGNSHLNSNFVKFDASNPQNAFFEAARRGELPAVSWVEPMWGGGKRWDFTYRGVGNDMHPVSDTTTAEDFVMNLYAALTQSPKWNNTLFVITFDENGGTYDHVVPPAALPSGNDQVPYPRQDMDQTTRTQFGFDFTQYGIRVPTLLISPCIPPGTIFRSTDPTTPYDHTSLIATILTLAGIDPSRWMMGERVANAPTFEGVLAPPEKRDVYAALSVPFSRSDGEALAYNTDYQFEFVGNLWHQQPGPTYLAAFSAGRLSYYKYPTVISDPGSALPFRLVPDNGGPDVGLVTNMSQLMIKTTEPSLGKTPFFTVSWENSCVYYDANKGAPSHWQIRILGSRNPADQVRVGDYVYFVAALPPPFYKPFAAMQPDPIQRLIPHPDNPDFVTTRPGEWALWRITAAPSVENV